MPNFSLPIWRLHARILETLTASSRLALVAATGSGKSTQVPQMILDAGLNSGKRIVVLQPRRVAARTVAARVAWERNVPLGAEVGYQVRFDDLLSSASRICFVTEGILLRWLQSDPHLSDVGAILFDEFHERNLLSDVALGLVRRLQENLRPDLKLVVMSATLDAEPVARFLDNAQILSSEGRTFPVSIRWAEYGDERPISEQAADSVERIIHSGDTGDILVFMPGMGEINATINALRSASLAERCAFIPLHGDLAPEDQDRAFQASPVRKIIVATNVAETSVTVDGVCHVVDSGLARIARYDADRGIQTLALEEISRASADQRSGRAGRTAPGTCWRLWTESGHLNRLPRNTPEIQRADLAEVVLLLHSLGIPRALDFEWLDAPDRPAVERAENLLRMLGAISAEGHLTGVGRQMLHLPMHPRYSRMLVEAARHRCVPAAALCAALTSGRDLLVRPGRDDVHLKDARELFEGSAVSDFHTLMRAHQFARNCNFDPGQCRRYGIRFETARQVEDTYRQIISVAERHGLISSGEQLSGDSDALPRSLLAGFPDQLAVRKDSGTLDCSIVGSRTGVLARESVVTAPLMVVASLREVDLRGNRSTLLTLATAVQRPWLAELFPQHISTAVEHVFDRTHKRVAAIRRTRFLGLLVGEEYEREIDPDASGAVLADAFARGWFELSKLDHDVKQFIARVNLVALALPQLDFPRMDGTALRLAMARAFKGLTLVKEAQAAELRPAFQRHLAPEQLGWLDELVPTSIAWSENRRVRLTYSEEISEEGEAPGGPEAQVKLNDCWHLTAHPRVGEGAIPVKLWLQLPDGKRLEATTDFLRWKVSDYPRHRSGLRAKYPGFVWP